MDIEALKANAMKPEEILNPSKREARAQELANWFARYAKGGANPKWVVGHAFDLALYIATQDQFPKPKGT